MFGSNYNDHRERLGWRAKTVEEADVFFYKMATWTLKSLHGGHTVSANSLEKLFGCNVPTVGMLNGLITGPQLNIVGMIAMNI
jgi:hypothetical protein